MAIRFALNALLNMLLYFVFAYVDRRAAVMILKQLCMTTARNNLICAVLVSVPFHIHWIFFVLEGIDAGSA